MTGKQFLMLSAKRQERVIAEIVAGERSPLIPGLEAAVRAVAAEQGLFADSIARSRIVGRYREAQAEQLRRMTPEERLLRYRKGRLTAYQGSVWESEFPKEIPRVNGIPEWRARHSVDVVG
jgi:hypothetical protein